MIMLKYILQDSLLHIVIIFNPGLCKLWGPTITHGPDGLPIFALCRSLCQHLHLAHKKNSHQLPSTWASWSTSEPSLQAPLIYAPSHVQCVCGITETASAVGRREFPDACCLPLCLSQVSLSLYLCYFSVWCSTACCFSSLAISCSFF